jgi:hypothetical protein
VAWKITRKELRNDSGELIPLRRRQFVTPEVIGTAFAEAPAIDRERFRADIDSVLDQDPGPGA